MLRTLALMLVLAVAAGASGVRVVCTDPGDCTSDVQQAFDDVSADAVTLPAPKSSGAPWQVRPLFIRRSNVVVTLEPGAVLEAKAGSFIGTNDCLLTIRNASNVTLTGSGWLLKMRRPYLPPRYAPAEWRHVLSIVASRNVTVVGGTLSDAGGDGIEVSGGFSPTEANFSASVTLRDLSIARAWRNGLSVISVKGLLVQDVTIRDTAGTNPMFGIDVEPDATPFGYLRDLVFRRVRLLNNLNGGFSMGLYGLVGEPGAVAPTGGLSLLVDGMEISGSTGNRTACACANGTRRVCSHSGVGMQLSNYPLGVKNGSVATGSATFRDTYIWNCSASGVDITNWDRGRIALAFDNLTIGSGVATLPEYWPGHPLSGPPVPIALAPYDDDPAHLVGGVTFGPRAATVDMRDFDHLSTPAPAPAPAARGGARPWLSVTYLSTPVGMADVAGAATVLVSDSVGKSMCEIAAGASAVNVSVSINCTTVGS